VNVRETAGSFDVEMCREQSYDVRDLLPYVQSHSLTLTREQKVVYELLATATRGRVQLVYTKEFSGIYQQSQLMFLIGVIIYHCITTCFGPYGPSSGEYNILPCF
jgi:hypothetical protein